MTLSGGSRAVSTTISLDKLQCPKVEVHLKLLSLLNSVLPFLIRLVSGCILMLPNRSNGAYPLFGVGTEGPPRARALLAEAYLF